MTDDQSASVRVPPLYSKRESVNGNTRRQVVVRGQVAHAWHLDDEISIRLETDEIVRAVAKKSGLTSFGLVSNTVGPSMPLTENCLANAQWVGEVSPTPGEEVRDSLVGSFTFKAADEENGVLGLRPPQLGATHAVLGYWTTSSADAATVVMPTGTGKTDTMVALFCAARLQRLLIIVPSDALRTQIAEKFETLGILQDFGVVGPKSLRPVVGQIKHNFKSEAEAVAFAKACNVIVATPNSLNASVEPIKQALLGEFSHLFIDEAHHVAAKTWSDIRASFKLERVVQFTATPFREDGRRLGGRLVYSYPLGLAQSEGYFSKINYVSVFDLGDVDAAIATEAINKLKSDLQEGRDHIIMARVDRISRAESVLDRYKKLAPELKPVLLHSNLKTGERNAGLDAIRRRVSRVIVCVDMLGEGFDQPALKIAAMHDPHKSLGVTIQFIGRFARTVGTILGDATIVVSRPDKRYDQRLRSLYAEDSDWNHLIRNLSEGTVNNQEKLSSFELGFSKVPEEVPLQSLFPKMTTVVYKTKATSWNPTSAIEAFREEERFTQPAINTQENIVWFVTREQTYVPWSNIRSLQDITYDLYIAYWNRNTQLLYINSSNKDSFHQEVAEKLCGTDAKKIDGETVYRVFGRIMRIIPTNVGVLDTRNRNRRFSLHVGADVLDAFSTAEMQTKARTNIFGFGYEGGERVSVGASAKGRVWSLSPAESLMEWMQWCNHIGAKLVDDNLTVTSISQSFIKPQHITERPSYVPLALEWPWELLMNVSDSIKLSFDEKAWPLLDVDLRITAFEKTGAIPFELVSPDWSIPYELVLDERGMTFNPLSTDGTVKSGFQDSIPLKDYLAKRGLTVLLEQEAEIVPPGFLLKPDRALAPFNRDDMNLVDWAGVDLKVESQGPTRRTDSIQYRVLEHVSKLQDWDLLIDDDGTGEVADIVGLKKDGQDLLIELVHCKWAHEGAVGPAPRKLVQAK